MAIPEGTDARDLHPEARRELRSLTKEHAEVVAQHLVMAGRLMDDDPEQALAHARAARAIAGRVGVVREANGLVAYAAGEWAEALSELRTARRISGEPEHLPVIADCERALGRPDRALAVSDDPQVARLDPASRVEMMIVVSGARRDLGQAEAAVVGLQVPALEGPVRAWTARLRYAYADALLDCGREDEARTWFARAAEVDEQGETDAEDRLMELDGLVFEDSEDSEDPEDSEGDDARVVERPAGASSTDSEAARAAVMEAFSGALDRASATPSAAPTEPIAETVQAPVVVVEQSHEPEEPAAVEVAEGPADVQPEEPSDAVERLAVEVESQHVEVSTLMASSQVKGGADPATGVEGVAFSGPREPAQDGEIPALTRVVAAPTFLSAPEPEDTAETSDTVDSDDDADDDLRLFD